MKSILLLPLMIGSLAQAAPSSNAVPSMFAKTSSEIETTCRFKAKEAAAVTYRGCVADQKAAQIEQLKKDYQAKLQALKSHYETELKKMSGAKSKASIENSNPSPEKNEKQEKSDQKSEESASSRAVSKRIVKKSIGLPGKKIAKKISTPEPESAPIQTEMTVELKPAAAVPATDDSVMDLPEPIPVDAGNPDSAI